MSSADPASTPPPPGNSGRLLLLAAAVLWSTSGFFAKAPIFDGWPGPVLAFWRAVFACLILLPMVRRPRWSPKLIPMVLLFTAMNFTFLSALTLTEAANAIWLQYTSPLWVFLVGVFLFREPVHARDRWLLICGMSGVALILAFELQGSDPRGVIYGLLSGLFFAGVVLSIRQLRDQESAWLIALNHLVAAALLAPLALRDEHWPQGAQWAYLAGFGMFQMGLPYVLFALGLKTVAGHEAAGISLLEPVLVPIWVYVAWHGADNYTPPHWWTLVGGGLILSGLYLRYQGLRRPTFRPRPGLPAPDARLPKE
ncbi:MAG: DMT family transporter [Pirellulaceae bacterium]|nr:DMT family transporter [Pirellulaceae bacterium]